MSRDLRLQLVLDTLDKASGPLKKIQIGSNKTAQALKASREALKGLQKQQRDISSFKKLQQAATDSSDKLKTAQARTSALAKQMAATEQPSKRLTAQFASATRQAKKLKNAHILNRDKLHALGKTLEESGIKTKRLDRYQAKLTRQMSSANTAIDQQKTKLAQLAKQQQRNNQLTKMSDRGAITAAKGAAGVAVGQRALGGITGLMDEGFDFDAVMSRVQALTRLEKKSAEMQALRAQARNLGATTSFTASETAGGQGFLAMAGFTPEAIKDAMPGMLSLAKSAGAELAQTADISSNILTGFELQANQMGRVGDVLTATFTRSNTDLQMLGQTMSYVAPIASKLGGNIEEVSALAGKLGDAGIQGSMAGTALRAIYGRLAAPPKAAADALAQLNIETKDSAGNLRPMVSILKDLAKQTQALGDAEKAGIFKDIAGDEAFGALSILATKAASGDIQKLINDIKGAQGEAGRAASIMSNNARGDIKAMASAWSDVQIGMEEAENGPIRQMIQDMTSLIRGVGEWTRKNPALTATLIKLFAILAVLAVVLGTIGIAIGGATMGYAGLAKAIPKVGAALKYVGALMAANPILIIITAIAVAAYLIYDNWAPISAFFKNLWADITAIFDTFVNYLGNIKTSMFNAGSEIVNGLIDGLKSKLTELKSTVTGLASGASSWFKDKLGIRSPSRVFIEHGSNVMAGLEKGLSNNRNTLRPMQDIGNRLKRVGTGLAIGAVAMNAAAFDNRAPLQAGGNSGAGSSLSIGAIHIHATPGMDEQALARMVAAEIQKIHTRAAASNRSRLSDED